MYMFSEMSQYCTAIQSICVSSLSLKYPIDINQQKCYCLPSSPSSPANSYFYSFTETQVLQICVFCNKNVFYKWKNLVCAVLYLLASKSI